MTETKSPETMHGTAIAPSSPLGQAIAALHTWQLIDVAGKPEETGTIVITREEDGTITRASAWIGPASGGRWLNLLTEQWSV
jgi:hypothetical protein